MGHQSLLARAEVHTALIAFGKAGPNHGAWLGAYVLMPDHLHAFVGLDDERLSVSRWMKSLKNALSKTLRTLEVPAPHWQKGFFDHVLRGEESYDEKWHYVRDNPVRAGLVRTWSGWKFGGELFDLRYEP